MENIIENHFERIQKGDEIEVTLNKVTIDGAECFSGRVVDNVRQLHIVDVDRNDIMFRYDEIRSVKFFNDNKQK
jgi:ribosome maturation factor RimP